MARPHAVVSIEVGWAGARRRVADTSRRGGGGGQARQAATAVSGRAASAGGPWTRGRGARSPFLTPIPFSLFLFGPICGWKQLPCPYCTLFGAPWGGSTAAPRRSCAGASLSRDGPAAPPPLTPPPGTLGLQSKRRRPFPPPRRQRQQRRVSPPGRPSRPRAPPAPPNRCRPPRPPTDSGAHSGQQLSGGRGPWEAPTTAATTGRAGGVVVAPRAHHHIAQAPAANGWGPVVARFPPRCPAPRSGGSCRVWPSPSAGHKSRCCAPFFE